MQIYGNFEGFLLQLIIGHEVWVGSFSWSLFWDVKAHPGTEPSPRLASCDPH